jgi:hypothetical protein
VDAPTPWLEFMELLWLELELLWLLWIPDWDGAVTSIFPND